MMLYYSWKLDDFESCEGCPMLQFNRGLRTYDCILDFDDASFPIGINAVHPRPQSCIDELEDKEAPDA